MTVVFIGKFKGSYTGDGDGGGGQEGEGCAWMLFMSEMS